MRFEFGFEKPPSVPSEEEFSLKESVSFIFNQNPRLKEIGTEEQYTRYVSGIFPSSKFKNIVYHNSNAEFTDEGFKPMKPNFDTLNSITGVYNFSSNREFIKRYGSRTYAVVLNINEPIEENSSGEYTDDMDTPLSQALFKIGKQEQDNPFAPKCDVTLQNTDAVINRISGEHYIAIHPVSGQEIGIPKQVIVTVFSPDQIHILGSSSDLKKFEEFVAAEK